MGPLGTEVTSLHTSSSVDSIHGQLEQVRRRSRAAHRIADQGPDTAPHELEGLLSQVEETLGTIAGDDRLDAGVTAKLRSVHDQLTSHLVAAASLEAIEFSRAAVVDVLRRAAEATEKALESVSDRP